MTPEQLKIIKGTSQESDDMCIRVHAKDFPEGTLLYGYTLDRDTFHVYVLGDKIHKLIYKDALKCDHEEEILEHVYGDYLPAQSLHPSKRAYPDQTRFDFAVFMKEHDIEVCYTTPSNRDQGIIAGEFTEGASTREA